MVEERVEKLEIFVLRWLIFADPVTHTRMHACMHARTHACTHAHTHTTHTQTHTHTHIYHYVCTLIPN